MKTFIENFPFHTKITVAWGEMDALNHVNNVVYFRYFEDARIDFFNQMGLLDMLVKEGIGPILAETQAKYRKTVTFPDTLLVGVKISHIQEDRFEMHYTVFSEKQQVITTTGWAKIVVYDFHKGTKTKLPESLIPFLSSQGVLMEEV